ncbi:MAG: efflux RND transporter periplasmic adaptor subunit [Planctomycetes bacterium]|nr:efflux RND transporter periplasmic adaptor subunit [Planctomycetota bacterium]
MGEKRSGNPVLGFCRRAVKPLVVLMVGAAAVLALSLLPETADESPAVEAPVVNVAVLELQPIARLEDRLTLKGVVAPWATVSLSAETSGRVERITVLEGDGVEPGRPLVYLDNDLLQATYDQALAQAELDAREVKRLESALAGGAATEMELDQAQSAAAVSKAAMQRALAELNRAVIRAPDAVYNAPDHVGTIGRVNDVPVELGQYVQAGRPVVEIVDTSTVRVFVDVPELDIRYIQTGQDVDVRVEALDDRQVAGTIHFISAVADPATRTFRAEVKVPNGDGDIRPGMFVQVRLLRRVLDDVLMIPLDAVIPLETDYEVYVSDGQRAHRRIVSLRGALIQGQYVEARPPTDPGAEGLRPGDDLIVEGQRLLGDGQRIRVRESVTGQLNAGGAAATRAAAEQERGEDVHQ